MFKHLLVPLDGSKLAESALPAAAYLADALRAKVTLCHIIEQDPPSTVHGEPHLKETGDAETYLAEIAARSFPPGAEVERHVHAARTHDVAEGIVVHECELAPDLVVMCTHGRHGLRRMLIGSIAEKVIASGRTPVLLIHAESAASGRDFTCHTLLAPVDGDPIHERGLDVAVALAAATGAKLHLLSVVSTPRKLSGRQVTTDRFSPGATRAALDIAAKNLESYVQARLSEIRDRGVTAFAEVRSGGTASVIADRAENLDASIIILGTHGRRGSEAFWSHSVGAMIQSKTGRPLLLVPVGRDTAIPR